MKKVPTTMTDDTKIERILKFISIISSRHDLTVDDMAREMETTRRTIYRYLGTLDNCGFTIEKRGRCFRLQGMPVGDGDRLVMLTEEECTLLGGLLEGYEEDAGIKKRLLGKLAGQERKEKESNGHAFVDLGLPSGTLWATCNIGASKPEEYGNHFAWGETEPKQDNEFNWTTYRWSAFGSRFLSKYCTKRNEGIADKMRELELCDDAASSRWEGNWRTPTKSQFEELCEKCDIQWTALGKVKGMMFTSRKNRKSIFLPASGARCKPVPGRRAVKGFYWTRTLSWRESCFLASMLEFPVSGRPTIGSGSRESGFCIRPVIEARKEE